MHISRKAEKVAKMPCLPSLEPKPAAAEKLPRSMMPPRTNTSGYFFRMWCRPQLPSRSLSNTRTLARRCSGVRASRIAVTILPKSSRFLPAPEEPSKVSGLLSPLAALSIATAAAWPRDSRYAAATSVLRTSWAWGLPSACGILGAIRRLTTSACGEASENARPSARKSDSSSSPATVAVVMPCPASVLATS